MSHPSFILGYWGAAMSLNQLLWNTESPHESRKLLEAGREAQRKYRVVLDAQEEMIFAAAEALNDEAAAMAARSRRRSAPSSSASYAADDIAPGNGNNSRQGEGTRALRYRGFQEACAAVYVAYPDDANAAALALLSLQV